jgi:hypothetical protein
MAERTQKPNESVSKDHRLSSSVVPGPSLAGKVFSIHADYGVWNQTDNRFENNDKILNHNRSGGQ